MAARARKKTKKKAASKVLEPRWFIPAVGGPARRKVYISGYELRQQVVKQLGKKLSKNFGLYVADSEYYCTPLRDARQIIKLSSVDRKRWVRNRFDCDDFAHVLKVSPKHRTETANGELPIVSELCGVCCPDHTRSTG